MVNRYLNCSTFLAGIYIPYIVIWKGYRLLTIATVILYTATMSTATNKSSTGSSTPLSTAASIIADLPDDKPRVSELIKFYELLIKGQLVEYLPLHDTEAIRKIRNAVNDRERMSLLIRAFEEDPTLLHKLREADGKEKGIIQSIIILICMLFIIAEQAGQSPKVKTPPPVPSKPPRAPKHSLSQSVEKSPSATTPTPSRTLSESTLKPPPPPTPPNHKKQKHYPNNLKSHRLQLLLHVMDTIRKHTQQATSSSKSTKTTKSITQATEQQQQSSLQPSEQSQGSSSLEYITLREMLADLVDLLAGNAPVITQLNNHLFSPGLIPKAVHIAVETIGLTPYDRANKMINAVLATFEYHPNPNSAFTSFITALCKVGLTIITTKLTDALSKRI